MSFAREEYVMIDIESTGTNKKTDDLLEVAAVKIERLKDGFWRLTSDKPFVRKIFSNRKPESEFAKKHMTKLYEACNLLNSERDDVGSVSEHFRIWLHGEENYLQPHQIPKYFMGWNASNFDLEFCFIKGFMTPSYYAPNEEGVETLYGDAHYRVYEQTGAIELLVDSTGFSRKTVLAMAEEMIPSWVKLEMPEGKEHDALYDCYSQINMMNGLIALAKSGIKNHGTY